MSSLILNASRLIIFSWILVVTWLCTWWSTWLSTSKLGSVIDEWKVTSDGFSRYVINKKHHVIFFFQHVLDLNKERMFQIWIATAKLRQINNQVARQFQVTRKTGPGTVIISGQSHQIMRAKSKVQLNNTQLQIASPFARVQTVLSVFDILHRKIIYWGNNIKSPRRYFFDGKIRHYI